MKTATQKKKLPLQVMVDKELDKVDISALKTKVDKANEFLRKHPLPAELKP